MSKRSTNEHQKSKYKAHPSIALANKKRRIAKHAKQHPADQIAAETVQKVNL